MQVVSPPSLIKSLAFAVASVVSTTADAVHPFLKPDKREIGISISVSWKMP
jgi:hypothetical protein